MTRKRLSRERLRELHSPQRLATRYIRPIEELAATTRDLRAYLYFRVSTRHQRGNLRSQALQVKRTLRDLGIEWVGGCRVVGPASSPEAKRQLAEAVENALQHGAVVVAESVSRFIRPSRYDARQRWSLEPDEFDFEELAALTRHVVLATVLHPNENPRKERSMQIKRGLITRKKRTVQSEMDRTPGYMKRRREEKLRMVLDLLKTHSYREVSRRTGIPHSTIQGWTNR